LRNLYGEWEGGMWYGIGVVLLACSVGIHWRKRSVAWDVVGGVLAMLSMLFIAYGFSELVSG